MGRIKTAGIKRIAKELMRRQGDKSSTDFNQNKLFVSHSTDVSSKKLRNIIAGYVTRLKRKVA